MTSKGLSWKSKWMTKIVLASGLMINYGLKVRQPKFFWTYYTINFLCWNNSFYIRGFIRRKCVTCIPCNAYCPRYSSLQLASIGVVKKWVDNWTMVDTCGLTLLSVLWQKWLQTVKHPIIYYSNIIVFKNRWSVLCNFVENLHDIHIISPMHY